MSERTKRRRALPLCSVIAQERGLDPIGDAYSADHYLIIESPTPWPEDRWETPGTLPASLLELTQKVLWVEYPTQWVNAQICVVAPDKGYSQPGLRRVVYCRRPSSPFAEFARDEYLLPEAEIAPLAWAILPSRKSWRNLSSIVSRIARCVTFWSAWMASSTALAPSMA